MTTIDGLIFKLSFAIEIEGEHIASGLVLAPDDDPLANHVAITDNNGYSEQDWEMIEELNDAISLTADIYDNQH